MIEALEQIDKEIFVETQDEMIRVIEALEVLGAHINRHYSPEEFTSHRRWAFPRRIFVHGGQIDHNIAKLSDRRRYLSVEDFEKSDPVCCTGIDEIL